MNDPSAGVYPTPGLVTDNVPVALAPTPIKSPCPVLFAEVPW